MKTPKVEAGFQEPDMTPMIDIVFQLLTFFMIISNFESTKADERVKLPKDMLAKPPESRPEDQLTLNYGFDRFSDGTKKSPEPVLFYAGSEVRLTDIKPLLEQEKRVFIAKRGEAALGDVTVEIRADADVPTGQVQLLIKECQQVGYTKFALKATQEE